MIEYELSNLQVLAILSFDQREHILKEKAIVQSIESKLNSLARNGWFDTDEEKTHKEVHYDEAKNNDNANNSPTRFAMPDWSKSELKDSDRKDFILALSIIFSNL